MSVCGVLSVEATRKGDAMALVLGMMIGLMLLVGRSRGKGSDLSLVEFVLGALFLLLAFGQSAG